MYDFTLKINSKEVVPGLIADLQVSSSMDALDSFSCRLKLRLADMNKDLPCDIGKPWSVKIGATTYAGDIVRIIYTTGMDPSITFVGLEKLHRLRGIPWAEVFKDPKHTVATTLANKGGVTLSATALKGTASEMPVVTEDILGTIKQYAHEAGYAIFFDGKKIQFAPRETPGGSVTMKWNEEIFGVDMTCDISQVATKVQVYGRDYRKSMENVTFTAQEAQLKKLSGGDTGVKLRKSMNAMDMIFDYGVDVTTATAAEDLATGEIRRRAATFVRGSLRCRGEPLAIPTSKITLTNAPWPLKGPFMIYAVTHSFNSYEAHRTNIDFYSDSLPSK